MFRSVFAVYVTLPILCTSAFARHPISVTDAQVYVSKTAARMRITLFAEDLYLFHNLVASDAESIPPKELKRGLEAHRKFLLDKVTLRDATGQKFAGNITDVTPFEIPEAGIEVDDLMQHQATYEIEFPFDTPPEFLTIQQDISDENFIFPSEMKLVLHQAGTELTYTENLKPGDPKTIRFDWSGTVPSEANSEEEWEKWFQRQREDTLGITSYSSVYSFIYIEPAEVRHEVLIPLANLKTVLPLEHADPSFVTVEEQEGIRELLREWLSEDNPTSINGQSVQPEFTRIDFYGLDLKDFARQAKQKPVSLANGRVGVIMTYRPTNDRVTHVELRWDKFNSAMRKIRSVVMTWPDDMQRFEFSRFNTPEENTLVWNIPASARRAEPMPVAVDLPRLPRMRIPVGSVCLGLTAIVIAMVSNFRSLRIPASLLVLAVLTFPFAGANIPHPWRSPEPLSEQQTSQIFEELHSTSYSALDQGNQEAVFDALDTAIGDELLETVYLQLRESLRVKEQGGAVARVRSVDYEQGEPLPTADSQWPAFSYRSSWTVSGTVEHWGHIHERQNQFTAVFSVEPREGFWKITSMKIEEQLSVASSTRLRSF